MTHHRTRLPALALVAAWLSPLAATAGFITLETEPASAFRDGRVTAGARIANRGSEPACEVRLRAELGEAAAASAVSDFLPPDETASGSVDLPAPAAPGQHTAVLRVSYTDVNGKLYEALRTVPVLTGPPPMGHGRIAGWMSELRLRKEGTLTLILSSTLPDPAVAGVRLVLPHGLECAHPFRMAAVSTNNAALLEFEVVNRAALPGSAYPVFAVIDYAHEGLHRSGSVRGRIHIAPPFLRSATARRVMWVVPALLLLLFAAAQSVARRRPPPAPPTRQAGRRQALLLLALLALFTAAHIPPHYLFTPTLPAGGDTPAHLYLASHLQQHLFQHGRIVSWAEGWWCGFPMFQFYFCLPYVLMALLGALIPLETAFKLVSVLGIFALPAAAYAAGRMMRLRGRTPELLTIATIPLLFDRGNTMWGVNIYSTLAGMIANSLSFPLMLLTIASGLRDADDGRFRMRTSLLFAATLASHFFTSIMAVLALAIVPLLAPRAGFRRAFLALAAAGTLGLLLMAWWLVPLVAKYGYTVGFGTNWRVGAFEGMEAMLLWLCLPAAAGLALGLARRERFSVVLAWMFVASLLLFHFGYDVSSVFVNVRLRPFILFSVLALSAVGIGLAVERLRAPGLAVAAAAAAALTVGIGQPNTVRDWVKWNYEGLAAKRNGAVLHRLLGPLAGTDGRLAFDLHAHNSSLGSTRIFELAPYLAGKPIIEGGLVTSGLGALFAYRIQGETSLSSAGLPLRVEPAGFDMQLATAHLELFNVKHFIARSARTKAALAAMQEWQFLRRARYWDLYELTSHDGHYVVVPDRDPAALRTPDRQGAALAWFEQPALMDRPVALLAPGEEADPALGPVSEHRAAEPVEAALAEAARASGRGTAPEPAPAARAVLSEHVTDRSVSFATTAVGRPHIVKCSYFPNWRVRGAGRVHWVTPCFMLVYPTQTRVTLYYGRTLSDNAGRVLSCGGLIALVCLAVWRRRRQRTRQCKTC